MNAKCLMIQGTASSVGKSLLTAGLCRIFRQEGYRVSPFKSQNMALNSFITKDGKEMGRAQAVQAEAAGVEPTEAMNPILIKPSSDKQAQVIVKGKVYGNMSAMQYHDFKKNFSEMIRETYRSLAMKNDIIVIEGAGSPAEINLRERDIVNMGMAEIADAPVVLVGDIDKGGVFASLAGTMLLLTPEEKKRIKGVIINKFRGDIEILKPGIKMLEDIIKVPVLGIVPYTRFNIDDEDGFLSENISRSLSGCRQEIDIAVIRHPHLSNFTDFNSFRNIEGVSLRYVENVSSLKKPDMIILPGTKSTISDFLLLRESGLEKAIRDLHSQGTILIGICGGYQMLGKRISDPLFIESQNSSTEGMGLLDIETVFRDTKITTQIKAEVVSDEGLLKGLKGKTIEGYEIHMGITQYGKEFLPFILAENSMGKQMGGIVNKKGDVFGTYIHGIFDNMEFTRGVVNNLRKNKGLKNITTDISDYKVFKEKEYNRLAEVLRKSLDMNKIFEILENK